MASMQAGADQETQSRRWMVCGMLLLALVLNYMDRQTLSLTITTIDKEFDLTHTQYGRMEKGFGYAFAVGGLVFGFLADRVSVRWLYPFVLLGWSAAGIATGFADRIGRVVTPLFSMLGDAPEGALAENAANAQAYYGFMFCRVVLGLFEAGQWPCALVTTQRLLSPADRAFGNSILQSGASLGAILTPLVVGWFDSGEPGWWRWPYVVVGGLGLLWVMPWQWITWGLNVSPPSRSPSEGQSAAGDEESLARLFTWATIRRFLALVAVVVVINMTWQFFRVWLPKMLEQYHEYSKEHVRWFIVAYYVATDVGCLLSGAVVKRLANRGWDVHRARMLVFLFCSVLTSVSVVAAYLPKSPLLLFLLLTIGFGTLGLFPIYYSFTQELTRRYQGMVTGSLGFITWIITSEMQESVGMHVDATNSYREAIFWLGLAPLVGAIAMFLLWGKTMKEHLPAGK